MKANATQSVREALRVIRQAEASRRAVAVDEHGNLVYANAVRNPGRPAEAGREPEAIAVLVAKIENELAMHARNMDEVREQLIPACLPSLVLLKITKDKARLGAIDSLVSEWNRFIQSHDAADHREWQQTLLRRYDLLNRIGDSLPLGLKCSPEEGVMAASTRVLSREETAVLLQRLMDPACSGIDPAYDISEQTVKDAPRTPLIRLAFADEDGSGNMPPELHLKYPQPGELRAALYAFYGHRYPPARGGDQDDPGDRASRFVRTVSLLLNQTVPNLLDEALPQPGEMAVFRKAATTEDLQIHFDADGNVIVDRTRWERWTSFIQSGLGLPPLPLNQGPAWEGPLDDAHCSYRTHISLRLRREDADEGRFRPDVTRSPQLSACIELDWKHIDPVLRTKAKARRTASSNNGKPPYLSS